MNINEMKESKYLKKEDCEPPIAVTIASISNENMAKEGEPIEMKWVIHFSEDIKPLAANMTNLRLIAHVLKSEETNDWMGKQINLYNDPTVSFGDRVTGGIRVLIAPPAAPQAAPAQSVGEMNDEIPF